MKKTILLPTDFSVCADIALEFTIDLAKRLHTEHIVLLYANDVSEAVLAQPMIHISKNALEAENAFALARRKELLESKLNTPTITVETLQLNGSLTHSIKQLEKENTFQWIVLGLTGKNKLEQKLIGSNSYAVLKSANTPVCIVPDNTSSDQNTSRVTAALDLNEKPDNLQKALLQLGTLLDALKSNICRIIYVGAVDSEKLEAFRQQAKTSISDKYSIQIEVDFITNDNNNISEAIANDLTENPTNALILIERHYNLLTSLFHSRIIKSLAFKATVPLFVLEGDGNILSK